VFTVLMIKTLVLESIKAVQKDVALAIFSEE
jgi:hypothetical protein